VAQKTKIPVWPLVGVALFVFFAVVASIWLALALALCVGILLLAHVAWTKLPEYFNRPPKRPEPPTQTRRRAR
jgi:hypothetical protein